MIIWEKSRDICPGSGPRWGEWSEQSDQEEKQQKMRLEVRHSDSLQSSPGFMFLKITKSTSLNIQNKRAVILPYKGSINQWFKRHFTLNLQCLSKFRQGKIQVLSAHAALYLEQHFEFQSKLYNGSYQPVIMLCNFTANYGMTVGSL